MWYNLAVIKCITVSADTDFVFLQSLSIVIYTFCAGTSTFPPLEMPTLQVKVSRWLIVKVYMIAESLVRKQNTVFDRIGNNK